LLEHLHDVELLVVIGLGQGPVEPDLEQVQSVKRVDRLRISHRDRGDANVGCQPCDRGGQSAERRNGATAAK
jgi:hypothetical protein